MLIYDFVDSEEPGTLINSQIDVLYKRLRSFLDEVCNGNISAYCDDSDDTIKLAKIIKNRLLSEDIQVDQLLKIKFYIITNKVSVSYINTSFRNRIYLK